MDAKKKPYRYMIGIDEAGRGPLAGPVVVAGILVSAHFNQHRELKGIKDSKKLTQKQRDEWYARLIAHGDIRYAISRVSPQVIDRIHIAQACYRGAQTVYDTLSTSMRRCIEVRRTHAKKTSSKNNNVICHALLDGSLKLHKEASYEVIIRGDEKIPIISAASIIAKVTRDRLMGKLHAQYPKYGFNEHKGYGTKKHIAAIKKYGYSKIHRKTFIFDKKRIMVY